MAAVKIYWWYKDKLKPCKLGKNRNNIESSLFYVNWIYTGKSLSKTFTEVDRKDLCVETRSIDHIYKNVVFIQKTKIENDLRITAVKLLPSPLYPPGPSNDHI